MAEERENGGSLVGAVVFSIITVVVFDIVFLYMTKNGGNGFETWRKVILILLSILYVPLGVIGFVVGNKIRLFTHPDAVITDGKVSSIFFTKVFWKIGPQVCGTVVVVFFAWLLGINGMTKSIAKAQVKQQAVAERAAAEQKAVADKAAAEQQAVADKQKEAKEKEAKGVRDAFIKKYIGDVQFEEVPFDKVETFLKRNNGKVKNIKITGEQLGYGELDLSGLTGVETVDISEFISVGYQRIPDTKAVIAQNSRDFNTKKPVENFTIEGVYYRKLEVLVLNYGLEEIEVFGLPKNLRAVYIPPTVTKISMDIFNPATEVVFAPGIRIERLDTDTDASTITIPDFVEGLYLHGGENLTEIKISEDSNLKDISIKSRNEAIKITPLYLPPAIEKIDRLPDSLKTLTIAAKEPPEVTSGSIPNAIEKIYVPAGSLKAYEEAWYDYEFTFNGQLQAIE